MTHLSLATKLWIPAALLAVMVLVMAITSAMRTATLQAAASAEQAAQQTKLELSARWMGLAEANAARAMAAAMSSDTTLAEQLKHDADATESRIAEIRQQLQASATTPDERSALAGIAQQQKAFAAALAQSKDAAKPALA